jgi:hypothetical protein
MMPEHNPRSGRKFRSLRAIPKAQLDQLNLGSTDQSEAPIELAGRFTHAAEIACM